MAQADFAQVLQDLDALESELEPMRLAVDEGADRFGRAPTAREAAYRHLETALRHTLGSARGLIQGAEWDEPEGALEAVEILIEEEVLPERIGADIIDLAEFANEDDGDVPWQEEALFDRVSQGIDTLSEYLEYVHLFLKEWGE